MDIYVHRNGEQQGPYSTGELMQRIHKGLLSPGDLAWHQGLDRWRPVEEVFETLSPITQPGKAELSQSPSDDKGIVTSRPELLKRGYRWGRLLGVILIIQSGFLLLGVLSVLLKRRVATEELILLFLFLIPIILSAVSGIFIIKRRRWALVSGVILFFVMSFVVAVSASPLDPVSKTLPRLIVPSLITIANVIYVKRRWKEMEPRP